jgi:hypothetical protein
VKLVLNFRMVAKLTVVDLTFLFPVTYKTLSRSLAITSQNTLCMCAHMYMRACVYENRLLARSHSSRRSCGWPTHWRFLWFFSVMLMLNGYPSCKLHLYALEPSETVINEDLTSGSLMWD